VPSQSLTTGIRRPRANVRPMAWLLLVAAAAAVLAVGAAATVTMLVAVGPRTTPVPLRFWIALGLGAAATTFGLALRLLRWMFLLRRAGARVPLRDAYIGYLSGFALLFVPLLAGEIVLRAWIHRSRASVPVTTTFVVSLWERLLDVAALALIAAIAVGRLAGPQAALLPLTIVAVTATRSFRQVALDVAVAAANGIVRQFAPHEPQTEREDLNRLSSHSAWLAALVASVAAWIVPGLALWAMVSSWGVAFDVMQAQLAYAASALTGGLSLAPGGVRVVASALMSYLTPIGVSESDATLTVLGVRLATAGVAIVVGVIFVWMHIRTRPLASATHFDDIAQAYDAQIPPAQRAALLARKTTLMGRAIGDYGAGRRGLDVGCGQGWYVARMRELGYDVHGIDASPGQIALARQNVTAPDVIAEGSALRIGAPDASFDFVYCINVLHHLASPAEQRAAFAELLRVLRPGGLLFVHEINTRNPLFRFYMGYVFPSLNRIDEGTERWLLPHRLGELTPAPVVRTEYFTFMPEFVPSAVLRAFRPIEALLEASALRIFSAHYMAVLRKP
jgi:2-polyprenyl-3-methyl-5-hydroxy-6-metoxy-1,4-benzoquinol methylase